jgi:hypothetical protein
MEAVTTMKTMKDYTTHARALFAAHHTAADTITRRATLTATTGWSVRTISDVVDTIEAEDRAAAKKAARTSPEGPRYCYVCKQAIEGNTYAQDGAFRTARHVTCTRPMNGENRWPACTLVTDAIHDAANHPVSQQAERKMWLDEIARAILDLDTLETRNSDRLDFHEQSAEAIRRALTAAYEIGKKHGARKTGRTRKAAR